MGGEVRIVYRQEDGLIHTRNRYTNSMGRFLKSHRVAERDHQHMMEFFDNKNRVDQHLDRETTLLMLAPHGYGIVVVDFMANQIMAVQNYTSLQRIAPSEATGAFYRPEHRAECVKFFTDMADGRLSIKRRDYTVFQQNTTHVDTMGEPLTNAQAHIEAARMMKEFSAQNNPFRERVDSMITPEHHIDENFHLSFAPLDQSLLFQDSDATALLMVKTRMDETGFEFTKDEQVAWDSEIKKALRRNY